MPDHDTHADPDPDAINVRHLANAIRFFFFAIVLALSFISLISSQSISRFEVIYTDMLGGKPLPLMTQLVLNGRVLFIAMSLLISTAALGSLLSRRVVACIYILGALGILAIVESLFLYGALTLPLVEIMKQMGGGGGPGG